MSNAINKKAVKFGANGWRAIIGENYTFDNLEIVARATAQWLHKNYGPAPRVVIGHDTRFLGRAFCEHAAAVLASHRVQVFFSSTFTTTPSVSWAVTALRCDAGIVITASHNPPAYNGYKVKANTGGPAPLSMVAEIEKEYDHLADYTLKPFNEHLDAGTIQLYDIAEGYRELLRQKLDIEAIRSSGFRLVHDAMYGAGQGVIVNLLGEDRAIPLHHEINPGFNGQAPEPIEKNLGELADLVVREGCAVGLATDGDADRIGAFDERGRFVTSHQLLALLVKYLHKSLGLSGDIVKSFSTTSMLDKMGEAYGLRVHTTPIGFSHISPFIVHGDVLVGGEETGGIAVKGYLPERDGVYIGLLVVEMMVRQGKKLSELVQALFDEFGAHATYRIDYAIGVTQKEEILALLSGSALKTIDGQEVIKVETIDGFKHITARGWLLVRPSGTEPVLRIYAEAQSTEKAHAFVHDAAVQLGISNVESPAPQ